VASFFCISPYVSVGWLGLIALGRCQ